MEERVCSKCGSTKDIRRHHISYIPEITTDLCRNCDSKERRKPEHRGFRVLKAYPQRGMLLVPKDILMVLGDLVEMEYTPSFNVITLFPYGMSLYHKVGFTEIILRKLQLQLQLQLQLDKEPKTLPLKQSLLPE